MSELEKFAAEMKCDIISIPEEVCDHIINICEFSDCLPLKSAILSDKRLATYVEIETNNESQISGKIVHLIDGKKLGYWFLWNDEDELRFVPTIGNVQHVKIFADERLFKGIIFLFFGANQIMLEAPEFVEAKEVRARVGLNKKSKKQRNKKQPRTVFVYRSYNISPNAVKHSKQKKDIKCPEWSVRGHYRHYKSGKVVFINQYTKGKNRGKNLFESKEYKLIKEVKQ